MKKVYFDTETSGFTPGQIGQLSLIIEDDNLQNPIAKNYFFKIKSLEDSAAKACKRDLEFYEKASNGKEFKDFKDEILKDLNDATLIAHNLKFDENFISTEFWRQNIIFTPASRFDTMEYFKDIVKAVNKMGKPKNPRLEELVNYFDIDTDKVLKYTNMLYAGTYKSENISYHDARYDTTSIFVAMKIWADRLNNTDNWEKTFKRQVN
jgi:DNA polymerase-3 subunit epsilon